MKISKGLLPATRRRALSARLADYGQQLTQHSNIAVDDQGAMLDPMLRDADPVTSVWAAADLVEGRAPLMAPSRQDRLFRSFQQFWMRDGKKLRRAIIRHIEDALGGEFVLRGSN